MHPHTPLTRRGFLAGSLGAALAASLVTPAAAGAAPFAAVRRGRPTVTHGIQSTPLGRDGAVVWARADRPSRLVVDWSTSGRFADARHVVGPVATPEHDHTAVVDLSALPPGQRIAYRVQFEDLDDASLTSEPVAGHLVTPPGTGGRDVSFVWGGDTAGQGWGIDPDRGGMLTYDTMRQRCPDFFLHSGDTVYADGPLVESVPLPDGTVWRNLVTLEKSKVAETLDEFRGNHKYNLLDQHVRAMAADVPIIAQWDDHEVTNNWYAGEVLELEQYAVEDVDLLVARARQAFHEYYPLSPSPDAIGRVYRHVPYGPSLDLFVLDMRSNKGPNPSADEADPQPVLGAEQLAWLKGALRDSRATWKVIAADLPVGLVVPDGDEAIEGVADGRPGIGGREHELADLLSWIKHQHVRNVVWLTADVHYAAAHHYDPARAGYTDFDPFWEFVAGPLHAGTFGPNDLDATFGPEVVFQRAADTPNQPPSDGLQFFGHVHIAGDGEVMTVELVDRDGAVLHSQELEPQR